MSDDRLEWIQAAMHAVSKIDADNDDLVGVRCPKCNWSGFANVQDLYSDSLARIEEGLGSNDERAGGMTDAQIVAQLRPPTRKSAIRVGILVAVPLSALSYYILRRFGTNVGELSFVASFLITLTAFMTWMRRYSDQYYDRRKQWRSLYMCRRCGQLVAP
jgi:hypothetical protein